jgi:hypothetical protein
MSTVPYTFGDSNPYKTIGDAIATRVKGRIEKNQKEQTEIHNRAAAIHDAWYAHALKTGVDLEARSADRKDMFKQLHGARKTFTGNLSFNHGDLGISGTLREPAPRAPRQSAGGATAHSPIAPRTGGGFVELGPIIPSEPGPRPGHVLKTETGFQANPAYKQWKNQTGRRQAALQQAAGNPHRF